MILKANSVLFFMLFTSMQVFAQSTFEFELLARANLNDSYQLPPMSFMSNPMPMINDSGDVGFKIMSYQGLNSQGLWFKKSDEPNGKIVYTSPLDKFVTDPYLNNDGNLIFTQYEEELSEGVFNFKSDDFSTTQVLAPNNSEWLYYTYPQMSLNGDLIFRATSVSGVRSFLKSATSTNGDLKLILSEGESFLGKKTSYLFKPSVNEQGAFSFKRRLGEIGDWDEGFGDQILLMTPNDQNYEVEVVAEDRDSAPQSKFLSFGHSTGLSSDNSVAFTASMEDANGEIKRGVFLYLNKTILTVATEGTHNIKEIENFSPRTNSKGEVLFRAKDTQGLRGLYLAKAQSVVKIIGEGDSIEADQGQAFVLSNPNFPGFGGEVDINNNSEIVFSCLLISAKDKKEWGTAVYKVKPQ